MSDQAAQASTKDAPSDQGSECPICKMFREGGCQSQFDKFMDCGTEAEKGTVQYDECVKLFDAMRECMQQNPAVFAHLLPDVEGSEQQQEASKK